MNDVIKLGGTSYAYASDVNVYYVTVDGELVKRDIEKPAEPNDWWGDLEKAEYTMTVQLPSQDLGTSRKIAETFVDFLLDEEWKVMEQEEA